MNKELLMDLINKDIEKSCQFLLTLKPSAQHKQFKEELDELKQDFLTADYEIVQKTTDNAVQEFNSLLNNSINNNQQLSVTATHCLLPFLIYIKLFTYLKTHEINEQFILMMYRDLDTAKNFATVTNMKITAQSEKSAEMSAIALKKHAATRAKEQVAKEPIKQIWDQHNWASYAECADYIHKNALVGDLNHRKIYLLVSKVAKEKS